MKIHNLKSFLIVALGLGLVMILLLNNRGEHLIFSRYKILYDPQVTKCIPNYSWYLIDVWDRKLKRDRLYSFKAKGIALYPDGTNLLKYLRGLEGDLITIHDQKISINHKLVAVGLPLAKKVNLDVDRLKVNLVLKQDQYFMLGEHLLSFDSRYWGAIHADQIVGRAYPLF